ncbi:hypothetical protein M9458_008503, partial [Cirrhinus mrigala]
SPPASVLHVLLQQAHFLRSPELLPHPQPRTRGQLTDSGREASSRTPATPPRSGLPSENMASHINLKDIMDSCGLFSPFSPSSPLVPSSPPKYPLVPSMPPEHPPEPESPPECPPEPELPPECPPEPELPPEPPPVPELPPERPPEPAPPVRPPVPAPPERPPPPTHHSRLNCLPDPPWHTGLYAPPWLPELPDPYLLSLLCLPCTSLQGAHLPSPVYFVTVRVAPYWGGGVMSHP